jgi:hypothetical protein
MKRLLVVLALTAAVLTAGCSSGAVVKAPVEPVRLQLLIMNAQPSLEEAFVIGHEVRIKDSGAVLGSITEVVVEPALMAVPDSTGSLQAARSPVLVDVTLTIEGEASVSDAGYSFGGTYVYMNNDLDYLTPVVRFKGIILSMKPVDEIQ